MKYEVTRQGTGEGARDAERDGGQQLSPLREAELPLRDRGGATCTDGSQLFAGEPNQVLDPSTGDGGTGSPSDAALSRGTRSPGGTRGGRPHRAGEQPFTSPKSEEPSPFSASCFSTHQGYAFTPSWSELDLHTRPLGACRHRHNRNLCPSRYRVEASRPRKGVPELDIARFASMDRGCGPSHLVDASLTNRYSIMRS